MTDIVDSTEIERIVGTARDATGHYGRADSDTHTFYILHSAKCLIDNNDLRKCRFSVALDRGINYTLWKDWQDEPVPLVIIDNKLWPLMRYKTQQSLETT